MLEGELDEPTRRWLLAAEASVMRTFDPGTCAGCAGLDAEAADRVVNGLRATGMIVDEPGDRLRLSVEGLELARALRSGAPPNPNWQSGR